MDSIQSMTFSVNNLESATIQVGDDPPIKLKNLQLDGKLLQKHQLEARITQAGDGSYSVMLVNQSASTGLSRFDYELNGSACVSRINEGSAFGETLASGEQHYDIESVPLSKSKLMSLNTASTKQISGSDLINGNFLSQQRSLLDEPPHALPKIVIQERQSFSVSVSQEQDHRHSIDSYPSDSDLRLSIDSRVSIDSRADSVLDSVFADDDIMLEMPSLPRWRTESFSELDVDDDLSIDWAETQASYVGALESIQQQYIDMLEVTLQEIDDAARELENLIDSNYDDA